MRYRIQFFLADRKTGDVPCDKPLPSMREYAVDLMPLFRADQAVIIDEAGQVIERLGRST